MTVLCLDIGSTWTKGALVSHAGELLGTAQHTTTPPEVLQGIDAVTNALGGTAAEPAFALRIEAAPEAIAAADTVAGATALNAAVEAIARRDPSQYQWTYKRYTLRPPESGETNPYRDLERH